jgi:hypothetical protein
MGGNMGEVGTTDEPGTRWREVFGIGILLEPARVGPRSGLRVHRRARTPRATFGELLLIFVLGAAIALVVSRTLARATLLPDPVTVLPWEISRASTRPLRPTW